MQLQEQRMRSQLLRRQLLSIVGDGLVLGCESAIVLRCLLAFRGGDKQLCAGQEDASGKVN